MADLQERPKVSKAGPKPQFRATAGAILRAIEAVQWNRERESFGLSLTDPFGVKFTCSADDGSASAVLSCDVQGIARAVVPLSFRATRAAFSSIPKESEVTVDVDGDGLKVSYPGGSREVPCWSLGGKKSKVCGVTVPVKALAPKASEWPFSAEQTRAIQDHLVPALAGDMHRMALTGAFCNPATGVIVTTDTHRLAVRSFPGIMKDCPGFILPGWALKRMGTEGATLYWLGQDTWVRVESGALTCIYYAEAIRGVYPKWERVVPNEYARFFSVDAKSLAEGVRRVAVVAKQSLNRTVISFGKTLLTGVSPDDVSLVLSASAEAFGKASEAVPLRESSNLEGFVIGINATYLAHAAKGLGSRFVTFEMREPNSPVVVRSSEDKAAMVVIMPMALR